MEIVKIKASEDTCLAARELRLRYVKVRTGTAEIHKELKAFYLQGGRFVDGWKNAQLMASEGIETKLQDIESHFENLENERIEKLQEKRAKELDKYEPEYIPEDLGDMPEEVWNSFLIGTKTTFEKKKEAERKEEEERIAKEKAEKEEQEKIRLENEELKKEADAAEKKRKVEEAKRKKEEEERAKKEEADRKERELAETARKVKEENERKVQEVKLEKEKEEREKAQAELRAKKEAEDRAKAEEAVRLEAELNKGDVAKVKDLIDDLVSLKGKYQFKSAKSKKMYADVGALIDKVVNHIKK